MKLGKRKKVDINLSRLSLERLERIPLLKLSYTSFALSIFTILVVVIMQGRLPPEVPLFYGLPLSEEQLASSIELTLPGVFALTVVSLNLFLAFFLNDKFLQQAAIVVGFSVSLLSLITTIKIVFLVGNF